MRDTRRLSWIGLVLAGTVAAIAGCTVVVEDDGGPRPRPPEPAFCTREYAPVCARRGGERRTFSNACMADASGWRVVRDGECRREREPREEEFCAKIYRPVCAMRRGDLRTFPNACEARAEDYRVIDNNPC